MQYIIAAASLFAQMHKLQMSGDTAAIQETLHSTTLLPFKPQAGVKIPVTDEELQETSTAAGKEFLPCLALPCLITALLPEQMILGALGVYEGGGHS